MVKKCSYCGEIKPCRKRRLYTDGAGVGYPCNYIGSEWKCKDCIDYDKYQNKKNEEKMKEKMKENKENKEKAFIKKRDKVLKKLRSEK